MAALAASAKRGKWLARRRIFSRWLGWVVWSVVLPVIGLLSLVAVLAGMAFWQYWGHDAAYAAAQTWVQQEFGSLKARSSANHTNNTPQTTHNNSPAPSRPENASMINLTDEATPDLQIDRHLTIKTTP
ncbi:MAG: hypothetical protein ABL923_07485 [Burkholderiaceae bacterium]